MAGWLVASSAVGCGPTSREPKLDAIDDQTGFVGSELMITVRASDPDADALTFGFDVPEIPDLDTRATLRPYGTDGSTAVFRWTPIAKDVGTWLIDFEVTDGGTTIRETVSIEIKAAVGSNESPFFLSPLGNSVSLHLATSKCIDLNVEIEDPDDARVDIAQEPALLEGGTLTVTGDKAAKWHWCPSAAQIAAQDRYPLTLSASDGTSPKTTKALLILIVKEPMTGCPGVAPTIAHTAANVSSLVALPIAAQVTDDLGLKSGPVLYYGKTAPASPVNLASLTPVAAHLESGDMKNGHWVAEVPNPVADLAMGATATLYYVWVAADNDDAGGDCDHTTQAPPSGVYQMVVQNPGGAANLQTCAECTADSQCGGAADNCVTVGSGKYCGKGCSGDGDCPTNYQCSAAALTSVNGATARQCVPKSGSCTMVTPPACTEDSSEENDTLTAASSKPALVAGTDYDLEVCPASGSGVDEDWFKIVVAGGDAEITVTLAGGSETDLDLQLMTASAAPLATSMANGSTESVTACVAAGTYYARIYSSAAAPKPVAYKLTYKQQSRSCAPATCVNDSLESNDSFEDALPLLPELGAKDEVTDLQICVADVDVFVLELLKDDVLRASLTFPQLGRPGDLDFYLYDGTATPNCDDDPTVCGDRADRNEYLEHTITHDGTYYLVVHGYNGAENRYDICVSLLPNQCPKYL